MRTHALLLACLAACQYPTVRPQREDDLLQRMQASPLLVELPPDVPSPALHPEGDSLTIADDTPYSLSFRGTPLSVAIETIAGHAGVTMLVDPSTSGDVFVDFADIALDDALETLLKQHDLVLLPGPGNVYFVERGDDPAQVTEFLQLVNVRAADVSANLEALVGLGAKIIVDVDRNLVCVVGRQSDISAVRRYLHHVDALKDQVLLEVHIFEAAYEDSFDLGAVHDISGELGDDAFQILSAFGRGSGFSFALTDNGGDFVTTIDAMRDYVTLDLVSSPRVIAVTNTQALVDIVREIPYVETTATTTGTTGGVGSTVQEVVKFKEAGVKLQMTPSIQEAGYLQIQIEQSLSEQVDTFNEIPVVDRRLLSSQFLVQDGNTIVLGGMIQERHFHRRTGIPVLMNIPILGYLFRGTEEVKQKQELLIFVTPRILSPSQAAQLAPHYQSSFRESRGELDFPVFGADGGQEAQEQ